MKKILISITCCLWMIGAVYGQSNQPLNTDTIKQNNGSKELTLRQALVLVQSTYNSKLRNRALRTIFKNAKAGVPEAMHAMGMASYKGIGINRNLDIAKKWFIRANQNGYLKSAYNLAMMYRLGIGVDQDFKTAYRYVVRAGENGDAQAVYIRGYLHYKGLGCTQSYDSAMTYFKAAADKGHGYAMYMIGLQYRNGYGVERNNGEANFWLKKAADKGVKPSAEELATDTPENPLRSTKLRSASANVGGKGIPETMLKKVRHTTSSYEQLQGVYTGTLATYDWSGQHVIKETPLEVTIVQNGNQITASWKEDTLSTVVARGVLTDTALVFTEAAYSKRDHYHRTTPVSFEFKTATLAFARADKTLNLSGNLQLYSLSSHEPEKPMYMSLQQKKSGAAPSSNLSAALSTEPMVYPNPFVSQLNLSFNLTSEAACSVSIYADNGKKVYHEALGMLAAGTHRYQLELNLLPASYVVQLVYGNKTYKTMIIKK